MRRCRRKRGRKSVPPTRRHTAASQKRRGRDCAAQRRRPARRAGTAAVWAARPNAASSSRVQRPPQPPTLCTAGLHSSITAAAHNTAVVPVSQRRLRPTEQHCRGRKTDRQRHEPCSAISGTYHPHRPCPAHCPPSRRATGRPSAGPPTPTCRRRPAATTGSQSRAVALKGEGGMPIYSSPRDAARDTRAVQKSTLFGRRAGGEDVEPRKAVMPGPGFPQRLVRAFPTQLAGRPPPSGLAVILRLVPTPVNIRVREAGGHRRFARDGDPEPGGGTDGTGRRGC